MTLRLEKKHAQHPNKRAKNSKQRFSHRFAGLLGKFGSSDSGSILPATAGAILALTSLTGVAVDGARLIYAKDVLQRSLDAAGLAAGNGETLEAIKEEAQAFFDANFNAAGGLLKDGKLITKVSADGKVIQLSAEGNVDATFTRLMGFENFSVNASTKITRASKGMELVLVMDNTGSTRKHGRMDGMKAAANNMIDILYEDRDEVQDLYVGLVPYVATVNIGPTNPTWLSFKSQEDIKNGIYKPTTWKGCVEARPDGHDETDATPDIAPFKHFFYEDNVDNDWRQGEPGDYTYKIDERNEAEGFGLGPNLGCGPAITPLIKNKGQIKTAIANMQSWNRGGTATNLGLVWGWRTLSPKWRGIWPNVDPDVLPLDYKTPYMEKVIVILTDGQNEVADFKKHGPGNGVGPRGSDQMAYGRIHDFGFGSINAARKELDKRMTRTCNAIKDEGVIIYTITFGTSVKQSARQLFEDCASNPGFYFHAPKNGDLNAVFEAIGTQLSNLRLSG